MIIFTKNHRPLTAKLMLQCMMLSLAMMILIPHVLEIVNFRYGIMESAVAAYISAICIVLGALSYIVGLIGLIFSILEYK